MKLPSTKFETLLIITYETLTQTLSHDTNTLTPTIISKMKVIECNYMCRCQILTRVEVVSISDTNLCRTPDQTYLQLDESVL